MSARSARQAMSGAEVRRLMRVHQWTIARFAARWSLTLRRIRHVRSDGVPDGVLAEDWRAMITGKWSDGTPV